MSDLTTYSGGVLAITGGGSGVGEGLARFAANIGMSVAIADIDLASAEAVVADITAAGGQALAHRVDVRDADSVEEWADTVYRELGPVTLLVNNAGIEQFGYLWDTPVENWRRLVDINITGVFNGIRAFVPRMAKAAAPARIWNLSSMGGVSAAARQGPYIMSKHAVLATTECLKLDIEAAGLPITVAAVLPGAVSSRIFERAGGVESGDADASESERESMLRVREQAMDPGEAAETVFRQAVAGEFYLLTQPALVGAAMDARADQLRGRHAPVLYEGEFTVPIE